MISQKKTMIFMKKYLLFQKASSGLASVIAYGPQVQVWSACRYLSGYHQCFKEVEKVTLHVTCFNP